MIVHIRGAGFINKGAELMLHTIVRRMRARYSEATLATKFRSRSVRQRAELGLHDLLWLDYHPVLGVKRLYNLLLQWISWRPRRPLEDLLPADVLQEGGREVSTELEHALRMLQAARSETAVLGNEVDLVLDAAGFAYGDPFGARKTLTAASYYAQVKHQGGRVILLPQQLGPFTNADVREAFSELSRHCDLIFARDDASFEAARPIVARPDALRQAPDFTIDQAGEVRHPERWEGRACVIPNFKMLEETDAATREAYLPFLLRCIEQLRSRDLDPFVLLHEYSGRDHRIAAELKGRVGRIEIVEDEDPIRIKGIIGASFLTVGSRFHGLVSALSQAVPSLATSWSHKYRMLLEEYGCSECLVSPTISDADLAVSIDRLTDPESHAHLVATLTDRNTHQKDRVRHMWREVDTLIQPHPSHP